MSAQRGSTSSTPSKVTSSNVEDEFSPDDYTDEELGEMLFQAEETNRILQLENEVFERYLLRHDPKSVHAMAQVIEEARKVERKASQLGPITSVLSLTSDRMGRRTSMGGGSNPVSAGTLNPRTSQIIQKRFRISVAHRIDMVRKEIDEMHKSAVETETCAERTRAHLRAQLEEVELRIRETGEARVELEENVAKRGIDPMTGKIPAEKFTRFMDEWVKAADNMIEKLRLKSTSLRIQSNKAKLQLTAREELGKILHPIDFEHLAIENQMYQQKIDEKNVHLLNLKRITGRRSLELSTQRQKLNKEIAELKSIERDVERKESLLKKITLDEESTTADFERVAEELFQIMDLMDEHNTPDMTNFVKLRTEIEEMKKTYKRLNRHRLIQRSAIKTTRQRIKRATLTKIDQRFEDPT